MEYGALLYECVQAFRKNPDLNRLGCPEDLAQDVYMRALERDRLPKEGDSFTERTWISRQVSWRSIDWFRVEYGRRRKSQYLRLVPLSEAEDKEDSKDVYGEIEVDRDVRTLLSGRLLEVAALRAQGHTQREVARRLGVSEGRVSQIMGEIRDILCRVYLR